MTFLDRAASLVEGLEKAPEPWKNFILDIAERLTNEIGRPDHPTPWPRPWFIEAYREGDHGIGLTLIAQAGTGERAHLRVVLVGTGVEADGGWAEPAKELHADEPISSFSMLVADIEPVEGGKWVVRWPRSLVRLYLIEDPSQLLGDAGADLDADTAVTVGRGRNLKDREAGGVVGLAAIRDDQLPGEMVKRDAKVVDGVPDDRAHNGGHRGHLPEPRDILGSLLIGLSNNGLVAGVHDSFGSTVKSFRWVFARSILTSTPDRSARFRGGIIYRNGCNADTTSPPTNM
jgi:hypothetical protein